MAFELVPVKEEFEIEGFHSIYYFEFDKDFYHQPERHNFWEFVYVDIGQIAVLAEEKYLSLSQGQVIFHKPNALHAHVSNKKDPNNILVVTFTCNSPAMERFDNLVCSLEKNSKKILSLFIDAAKDALGGIPDRFEDKGNLDFSNALFGKPQLLKCYLIEFLYSVIYNEMEKSKAPGTKLRSNVNDNSIADKVDLYLRNNISRNVTLQELSDTFLISQSYLSRIFKESTGQSIIDYFIDIKISEAKKLIRQHEYNITEIAEMLGYSSVHHFTRMFKKVTGFSPVEYKLSVKQS